MPSSPINLYLVQHAEPKPEEEDPDRPLSEKGWTDIRKVAELVADNIQVTSIKHSGKTRAKETAEALAEYLMPSEGVEEVKDIKPMADPSIWAGRLENISESTMLVGHLPYMSSLSALLLCGDAEKKVIDFQMGGIVCLQRDEEGNWVMGWMVTPQMLK